MWKSTYHALFVCTVGVVLAQNFVTSPNAAVGKTVALWLFDEQQGIYPSCTLEDASPNDYPLALGSGGQIVEGRYGGALEPLEQPKIELPLQNRYSGVERQPKLDATRKTPPMDWSNANFCALMTRGETHLRQEVGFASATETALNLANSDWTVEFWYRATRKTGSEGIVFEIGSGPRGESDRVTRLSINADGQAFTFWNQPSGARVRIPSSAAALSPESQKWHHFAFVYDAANQQLRHYVDGVRQSLPDKCTFHSLPVGSEDYLSIGRNGTWGQPLPGRIDELRISDGQVYGADFAPPDSFSKFNRSDYRPATLQAGPPLLFAEAPPINKPVALGGRKYLFIDDAIVDKSENVSFNVNPPRPAERVLNSIAGHLVVFEDDSGVIRLYCSEKGKALAVLTSRDGVHFEKPKINTTKTGRENIVIDEPVGMGTIFVDPNAPAEERFKYLSDFHARGIYVYTSPDGYHFRRNETAALPFRAASQSISYYDDQRQKYVAFHRSDMPESVAGKTQRSFVMTETTDVMRPWPFRPLTQAEQREVGKYRRIGTLIPWYLDNGPLTPGGFGVEYPLAFGPQEGFDPVGSDIYVPKNAKYSWATDTYLAFPIFYFHYDGDGPLTQQELGRKERGLGSGTLETQIETSRDGIHWKRYPRPAYIKIGRHDGFDIHKNYIAHGMVRRGDEIWQYYLGSEQYHSNWTRKGREAVFRVVQRFDGFISADTPYTGGSLVTRPLIFDGNRLVLNIDTGAAGYAQVGLLDEAGKPIQGFGADDCVYINGDFIGTEVEWLKKGHDLASLAGKPMRLEIRSRGTKLYSLQFVKR